MKTTLLTVALMAVLAAAMPAGSHDDIAYASLERRAHNNSIVSSRTVDDDGVITKIRTKTEEEHSEDLNEETGDVSSDSDKLHVVYTSVRDPHSGIHTKTEDKHHIISSSDSNTITGDFENDQDTVTLTKVNVHGGADKTKTETIAKTQVIENDGYDSVTGISKESEDTTVTLSASAQNHHTGYYKNGTLITNEFSGTTSNSQTQVNTEDSSSSIESRQKEKDGHWTTSSSLKFGEALSTETDLVNNVVTENTSDSFEIKGSAENTNTGFFVNGGFNVTATEMVEETDGEITDVGETYDTIATFNASKGIPGEEDCDDVTHNHDGHHDHEHSHGDDDDSSTEVPSDSPEMIKVYKEEEGKYGDWNTSSSLEYEANSSSTFDDVDLVENNSSTTAFTLRHSAANNVTGLNLDGVYKLSASDASVVIADGELVNQTISDSIKAKWGIEDTETGDYKKGSYKQTGEATELEADDIYEFNSKDTLKITEDEKVGNLTTTGLLKEFETEKEIENGPDDFLFENEYGLFVKVTEDDATIGQYNDESIDYNEKFQLINSDKVESELFNSTLISRNSTSNYYTGEASTYKNTLINDDFDVKDKVLGTELVGVFSDDVTVTTTTDAGEDAIVIAEAARLSRQVAVEEKAARWAAKEAARKAARDIAREAERKAAEDCEDDHNDSHNDHHHDHHEDPHHNDHPHHNNHPNNHPHHNNHPNNHNNHPNNHPHHNNHPNNHQNDHHHHNGHNNYHYEGPHHDYDHEFDHHHNEEKKSSGGHRGGRAGRYHKKPSEEDCEEEEVVKKTVANGVISNGGKTNGSRGTGTSNGSEGTGSSNASSESGASSIAVSVVVAVMCILLLV